MNYIFTYATIIKGHLFAQPYQFIRCADHARARMLEEAIDNGNSDRFELPEGTTDERPCDDCTTARLRRQGVAARLDVTLEPWRFTSCRLDDCHQLWRVMMRCCTSGYCWQCHAAGWPGRPMQERAVIEQMNRLHRDDAERVAKGWAAHGAWIEADVNQNVKARDMTHVWRHDDRARQASR